MTTSSKPWWRTEFYDIDTGVPAQFDNIESGPKGIALVKAWPNGTTDKGWGLMPPKGETEGFMPRYMRGEFSERRVLHGYTKGLWTFAFVMRSVRLVCIDIDGKNGGIQHAKKLGVLPPTMAETSKSGDGYHLFYLVEEEWDDVKGFGLLGDRIGIEQGVDIRATGCVYHHPQQRWNRRIPALLPDHLRELLLHREQKVTAAYDRIDTIIESGDDMEVLMLHHELITELKKPIPSGKRNTSLFAIGNKMRQAQVPGWEKEITQRGDAIGLPADEVEKIVANIVAYGDRVTP